MPNWIRRHFSRSFHFYSLPASLLCFALTYPQDCWCTEKDQLQCEETADLVLTNTKVLQKTTEAASPDKWEEAIQNILSPLVNSPDLALCPAKPRINPISKEISCESHITKVVKKSNGFQAVIPDTWRPVGKHLTAGGFTGIARFTGVPQTPICAAEEGNVLYSGWYGGYGKVVIVHYHCGLSVIYGHLGKLHVNQGEKVAPGQRLGEIGTTGICPKSAYGQLFVLITRCATE